MGVNPGWPGRFRIRKLEREAGHETPGTTSLVEWVYRLA